MCSVNERNGTSLYCALKKEHTDLTYLFCLKEMAHLKLIYPHMDVLISFKFFKGLNISLFAENTCAVRMNVLCDFVNKLHIWNWYACTWQGYFWVLVCTRYQEKRAQKGAQLNIWKCTWARLRVDFVDPTCAQLFADIARWSAQWRMHLNVLSRLQK